MILIPFLLMDQKLWAVQGELIVLLCFRLIVGRAYSMTFPCVSC